MKILMLGWELPPHNSGGLGVACMNLARALSNAGAEVDFLLPYQADYPEANFHIIPINDLAPFYNCDSGSYESKRIATKNIPNCQHKLSIRDIQKQYCDFIKTYLQTTRPDCVHAHDWLTFEAGIIAKKQFGIPLIVHVHATEFDRSGMNGGNPLIHDIEREAFKIADSIIAVSNATKNIIHHKYRVPLEKISILHNSLDEDYIKKPHNYEAANYKYLEALKKRGYTVISTVGRFTIQKGLPYMMRAAARSLAKNPKLVFIFAGDGEERNSLISLSSELGIENNVLFTGFIRGKKLRDVYSVSDIFVMSSVSEPFGLTALEAAHHDNVLILTNQSGVSEVLKSAFCYDFWDEEKLAREILKVADDSDLRDEVKNNLGAETSQLSWDKAAKKCLNIYSKICQQ